MATKRKGKLYRKIEHIHINYDYLMKYHEISIQSIDKADQEKKDIEIEKMKTILELKHYQLKNRNYSRGFKYVKRNGEEFYLVMYKNTEKQVSLYPIDCMFIDLFRDLNKGEVIQLQLDAKRELKKLQQITANRINKERKEQRKERAYKKEYEVNKWRYGTQGHSPHTIEDYVKFRKEQTS